MVAVVVIPFTFALDVWLAVIPVISIAVGRTDVIVAFEARVLAPVLNI